MSNKHARTAADTGASSSPASPSGPVGGAAGADSRRLSDALCEPSDGASNALAFIPRSTANLVSKGWRAVRNQHTTAVAVDGTGAWFARAGHVIDRVVVAIAKGAYGSWGRRSLSQQLYPCLTPRKSPPPARLSLAHTQAALTSETSIWCAVWGRGGAGGAERILRIYFPSPPSPQEWMLQPHRRGDRGASELLPASHRYSTCRLRSGHESCTGRAAQILPEPLHPQLHGHGAL